ncbi:hypothetical protein JCM19231_3137 [Vibrio ishigakensis]|uniref:Uncharacterized protein n=2 Tax=Vibrio ishigakensis TaxID=1481914 RepID=A0A0B8P067_9VIBR|nr:hypothetical protein [Vibrio ishigakensis]GAM56718.1 hypothetical protein JCM19231_3137 [Vibrio ishigakensis]
MELYTNFTQAFLSPALIGTLALFILVLTKGEICPGQRGRLHKQLLVCLGLLAVCIPNSWPTIIPFALVGFFVSQTKRGKTRDEGPVWALYASVVTLVFSTFYSWPTVTLGSGLYIIVLVALLGASLTHLLMTLARTRLQAFHTILPISGVVSAMVLVLVVLLQAYSHFGDDSDLVVDAILGAFPLLLTAIVVWCWHLFRNAKPNNPQLAIALVSNLVGAYMLLPLF